MCRIIFFLIALAIPQVSTSADTGLREGVYEIEVRLDLPLVLDTNTRKTERVCLTAKKSLTLGLAVLSDNNPLRKCPASNVAASVDALTFDINCPGVNSARGRASYLIAADSFRGRIEMKMGGKNMTMTEIQVGRRIDSCDAGEAR